MGKKSYYVILNKENIRECVGPFPNSRNVIFFINDHVLWSEWGPRIVGDISLMDLHGSIILPEEWVHPMERSNV